MEAWSTVHKVITGAHKHENAENGTSAELHVL